MKFSHFQIPAMSGKLGINFLALALGFTVFTAGTQTASAQSGAAKLRFLLNSHVYTGQRVTQDVRNATGDPYIQVIDRRHTFGEVYRCSYSYRGNPRYRILVCD